MKRFGELLERLYTADPKLTLDEARDALWLAPYLPAGVPSLGNSDVESARSGDIGFSTEIDRETLHRKATARRQAPGPFETLSEDIPLYPAQQGGTFADDVEERRLVPATRVRAPKARALPNARALARALRPLMRHVPSRTEVVLDEDATAQSFAEQLLMKQPAVSIVSALVLQPAPERWLDVALVVDTSNSMLPWQDTAREFRDLLARHGAFSDVRLWWLDTQSADALLLSETSPGGQIFHTRHAPQEIIRSHGGRLILVLTDCVAPAWQNGRVMKLLVEWGIQNCVAVLQVLPETMWYRTVMNPSDLLVSARLAGVPNTGLVAEMHPDIPPYIAAEMLRERKRRGAVAIPIVALDPRGLGGYAQLVAGLGRARVRAVDITVPSHPELPSEAHALETQQKADPLALVERFQATTDPITQQLAGYLALLPLNLSIMRMVQAVLLPISHLAHLAEFLNSGLVYRDLEAEKAAGEPVFNFVQGVRSTGVTGEGVRELLQRTIREAETLWVFRKVAEFFREEGGLGRGLPALAPHELGIETLVLSARTLPFARLQIDILERMGMRTEAERLRERGVTESPGASARRDKLSALPGDDRPLHAGTHREATGYDYIVVGSGAGGGTLAARLAEAGRRVLLLESGGDGRQMIGGHASQPGVNFMPSDYDVPAFHGFASENSAMSWNYFVRHYQSDYQQRRDPKFSPEQNGVLYPRAGTLGGCTAHNAMITVVPHNADWDHIATLTHDPSWGAEEMRKLFQRLENCHHRPLERAAAKIGIDPTRHGWHGWLHTERAIAEAAFGDRDLTKTLLSAAHEAFDAIGQPIEHLVELIDSGADPNDWRLVKDNAVGIRYAPLSTRNHARHGTRERVLDVAATHPDRLTIELNALATRVLFDETGRATGIEYLRGERLYRAHATPSNEDGELVTALAGQEVILSAGAFNTPQLLMLSGIGPRVQLERLGIRVRVDLPGVGLNLQDRYEVGVVSRMAFKAWEVLRGAAFSPGDPQHREWERSRSGVYTSNGSILATIRRSFPDRVQPDLFCSALLGQFGGYFPGYAAEASTRLNYLTWAIRKAHTENRSGTVTLRSIDPRDMPEVNFHYFQEGNDKAEADLASVVEGIRFARKLNESLRKAGLIAEEERPGATLQSDDELRTFVRDNAWGHDASCSCAIGPREAGGVLDSAFRVHGTHALRVVDASVFPRIPGFFIACAVYMIGEKAADVILAG